MSTKRIILLTLLGALLIAGGYIGYLLATTRNHSPAATVRHTIGGVDAEVMYCRPYKKERLIFGPESEGALLPWGEYWRTGANEATTLTLSGDVIFGGKPVSAGKYSLYTFPGQNTWTIGLNSEWDRWGYSEVDHEKDVVQVQAPTQTEASVTEQFTISFVEKGGQSLMQLAWDQTKVEVPIEAR